MAEQFVPGAVASKKSEDFFRRVHGLSLGQGGQSGPVRAPEKWTIGSIYPAVEDKLQGLEAEQKGDAFLPGVLLSVWKTVRQGKGEFYSSAEHRGVPTSWVTAEERPAGGRRNRMRKLSGSRGRFSTH